jgi:hypothetical protein
MESDKRSVKGAGSLIRAWRNDRGMAETATVVSSTNLADTKRSPVKRERRQWSEALKRRIVAEMLEPSASVSIVALRHDVKANQLF